MKAKLLTSPVRDVAKQAGILRTATKPKLVLVEGLMPKKNNPSSKPRESLTPALLDMALNIKEPKRSHAEAWSLVLEHEKLIPLWARKRGYFWVGHQYRADVIAECTCSCFISALKFDKKMNVTFETFAQSELGRASAFINRLVDKVYVSKNVRLAAARFARCMAQHPDNPEKAFMKKWGVSQRVADNGRVRYQRVRAVRVDVDGHNVFNSSKPSEASSEWNAYSFSPSSMHLIDPEQFLQIIFERAHDSEIIARRLNSILSVSLTPFQKQVVFLRLEADANGKVTTFEEIANQLGCTKQYANKECVKAFSRLRTGKFRHELKELMDSLPD